MNDLHYQDAFQQRRQRRTWPLATAALAVALIGSSCGTIGQVKEVSFAHVLKLLAEVLESGGALCAGGSDPVAKCVPRPQPKLPELRQLSLKLAPGIDTRRPTHALCELTYHLDTAVASCAEIYTVPPQ